MARLSAYQIETIVAEFERRWRSRTPARDVTEALPSSKVLWSETMDIVESVTGQDRHIDHRLELEPHIRKTLRRLKKEYPDLQW